MRRRSNGDQRDLDLSGGQCHEALFEQVEFFG